MCLAVCLPYWPCAHGCFDKGNNASQEVLSWWFEIIWQLCHCIYFASKQVLGFCICRSASLSLLCFWRTLTFSFAALAAFVGWVELAGRLWGLVLQKASLFVYIQESVCPNDKSRYLQLLTVLILLSQAYWFIPWEVTYGCVLPPILYKWYIK